VNHVADATSPELAIRARGLTKDFGHVVAVIAYLRVSRTQRLRKIDIDQDVVRAVDTNPG
jgi:hypothetical protein